ncbi:MAG TPA: hypothetical protein VHO25_24210 [Polyangiaceae bacterium]|nr:hypothetical protein [Polyangiaceae bacterium]
MRGAKKDIGVKALEAGIPDWVMSLPPSEARAMAAAAAREDEQALADDQEMLDAITGDDDGN